VRKSWTIPYLGPDGKTQVSVRYEDGRPVELTTVLISTQHTKDADLGNLSADWSSTSSPRCCRRR